MTPFLVQFTCFSPSLPRIQCHSPFPALKNSCPTVLCDFSALEKGEELKKNVEWKGEPSREGRRTGLETGREVYKCVVQKKERNADDVDKFF